MIDGDDVTDHAGDRHSLADVDVAPEGDGVGDPLDPVAGQVVGLQRPLLVVAEDERPRGSVGCTQTAGSSIESPVVPTGVVSRTDGAGAIGSSAANAGATRRDQQQQRDDRRRMDGSPPRCATTLCPPRANAPSAKWGTSARAGAGGSDTRWVLPRFEIVHRTRPVDLIRPGSDLDDPVAPYVAVTAELTGAGAGVGVAGGRGDRALRDLRRRRPRPARDHRRHLDHPPQPPVRPATGRRQRGGAEPHRHPRRGLHPGGRPVAGARSVRPARAVRPARRGLAEGSRGDLGRRRGRRAVGPLRAARAARPPRWSPTPTGRRTAKARATCSPPRVPALAPSRPDTRRCGRSTQRRSRSTIVPTSSSGDRPVRVCTATTPATWSATAIDGWWRPARGATSTRRVTITKWRRRSPRPRRTSPAARTCSTPARSRCRRRGSRRSASGTRTWCAPTTGGWSAT